MYRERIAQVYNQLSPSYRRIADFLLNNYREAAFMTAAELGQAVDVDTTTVVRCAQRLGYNGYPELIRDVQMQVKSELQRTYAPLEGDISTTATWQRSLLRDLENLQQTLGLSGEIVEALIEALKSARRILILGAGYSGYLGDAFATALRHLGVAADYVPAEVMSQSFALVQAGQGDVAIGISTSPYAGEVSVALQLAKERGVKTVGIFGSYASSIARVADLKIFAPAASAGPYASMTAIAAVLTAILQIIALSNPDSFSRLVTEFQRNYHSLVSHRDREAPDFRGLLSAPTDLESGKLG
ncbi:MAG: MurR/RpiR family transcriptional regulator [Anaerolineae bacterium]|nr:MurR/RpiR family transcriptional regulator [Anaerolineae bacterium]MDW8098778.1 MurR/RpiR family transcriptional regulator [Anaerolineae bacterium]